MIPRKAIQEEVARLLAQSKQRLPSVPPPLVLPLAALRQRLSPQTPFRLPPQNPRRLVLSTALLLTSIFLVVLFWSVHNDSSHTSTLSRLYLYEPDESFPATQLPSTNQHNDGVRKAKGKGMRPSKGKGAAKGNEKDEKPSPEPLPKFWSVHGGTGRGETNTTKPRGVNKVMGLVFYGRRSTASILDCYLKRNLVKNGGMLEGVVWAQQTTNPLDLVFLDRLITGEPDYRRLYVDNLSSSTSSVSPNRATGYDHIENDVLYIKIEDDIVFMEDTVVPTLVRTLSSRKRLSLVSANIVGPSSPSMNWIHWSSGAIQAYLPELTNDFPITTGRRIDWRASSLPTWTGPRSFNASSWSSPGNVPHRWLPVRGDEGSRLMNQTPMASARYEKRDTSPSSPSSKETAHTPIIRHKHAHQQWKTKDGGTSPPSSTWQMAAQAHYSLLDALEANDLGRYRFGLWDFHESSTTMTGLHLVAMTGKDINAAKPICSDDARHMIVTMPRKTGRHAVAAGEAVAAHYSPDGYRGRHRAQDGGLDSTDVLDRYRAFARENICAGGELLWSSVGDDPAVPWGV